MAVLRGMRPHQWVKNLFVFAPFLFEGHYDHLGRLLRVAAVFAIFCMLASGIYLLNDVMDREADRLHPRKRNRPIASGALGVPLALALSALLIVGGLAWAWFGIQRIPVTLVCGAYVVIQGAYSLWLKRLAIVDVLCIASGFLLRLIAGAQSAWVIQSKWILVCTIFVALFFALCKRRHEVTSLGDDAVGHRKILADYPPALLDQFIAVATAATLVSYTLYTFDSDTALAHGFPQLGKDPAPLLALTLPFVIYGLFRYLILVYRRDEGGSPTVTLLKDVPSLLNGLLYALCVGAVFLFGARS
jgi:4-hydroxybenzoate polyprenyltransferase